MDRVEIDSIRTATFRPERRGYDRREVEQFLNKLADWLEAGAQDEAGSFAVKQKLERAGEVTARVLATAEEEAEEMRREAREEADEERREAHETAERELREARETGERELREAREHAERVRADAEAEAAETIRQAEAKARRTIEEGEQRRSGIETVIGDLVARRDEVIAEMEGLQNELRATVKRHKPAPGADAFAEPETLDPAERGQADSEGIPA